MATKRRNIVVFSGGSAANNLIPAFDQIIERNACSISFVLPISDNGGSSSELIRVFGGPGIGDVCAGSALHVHLVDNSALADLVVTR